MALFNEILVGRLNRWVQKFYAIKSGTASLTQLLPTVQTINSVFSGAEDRYLQGWLLNMFAFNVAAPGAGNIAGAQVRNPKGSNIVAVMMSWVVTVIVTDAPLLTLIRGATTDLPTTSGITVSLDARASGSSIVPSLGSNGVSQPAGQTMQRNFVTSGQSDFLSNGVEIPILPGDALMLTSGTANTAIVSSCFFRTRPLESSELT